MENISNQRERKNENGSSQLNNITQVIILLTDYSLAIICLN